MPIKENNILTGMKTNWHDIFTGIKLPTTNWNNIEINLTEMLKAKGRLETLNSDMENIFRGVNDELGNVAKNISSRNLRVSISNIQEQVIDISTSLTTDMKNLAEFVEKQLKAYETTNEEAKTALENLISLINESFDEDGNIPIRDRDGYDSGKELLSKLDKKFGSSKTRWDRVDKMYYFFKEKGLSDEQIAGIIGNVTQESCFNLDEEYKGCLGLFQWKADRQPKSFDLQSQLDRAWEEIEHDSYRKVLERISKVTTVDEATFEFADAFENYTGEMEDRKDFAKAAYYYIKSNL